MGPQAPFRLPVTCCLARNVFFKTRLSSNAACYNNERTSSAVFEDASAASLVDSRGQFGCEPPGWSQKLPGDSLDPKSTGVKYCGQLISREGRLRSL